MVRPTRGGKEYDRVAFADYLRGLLEKHNQSMREASIKSGMTHGSMRRFIAEQDRPTRESCILIADHFGLNPNEVLTRAGYDPMHLFDQSLIDPDALPIEVAVLARHLSQIRPISRRRQLCQAIRDLLDLVNVADNGA